MQFTLVAALTLVSLVAPNMPAPMFSVGSTGVVAASADVSAEATANGPSVVEVPLEQTLEVRPAPGWSFASCDALLAATQLVTACTPESFTVTGPSFDNSWASRASASSLAGTCGRRMTIVAR